MRRTYRSKKDTGGALDHRDMLLNMDEKSSAFDAFYIQNLKQTKREISCISSSNYVGIAPKVRKRKYVKRLVKEVEPVRQKQTSTSAYLTPDKSIRVNKILDPFDLLLNSSPIAQAHLNPEVVEPFVPKKKSKTYVRKRKAKIKEFNHASTNSTESEKENTIDSNTTDIRLHELLVEEVPNKSYNYIDESINKIVGNLSLINNLKRKGANGSFNTSYKTRNRLTKNYASPILQKSPLCSTPFKEKYRGISIFKFSPITRKEQMGPTMEEKDESNNSIILVSNSLTQKSFNEYTLTHTPNISFKNITNKSDTDNIDQSSIIVPGNRVHNEIEVFDNQEPNNSISNSEQSSCQLAKAEPFLGFSYNASVGSTKEKMENILACLENQSIQDVYLDEIKLVTNKIDHNDSTNITDQNELVTNKTAPDDLSSDIDTDENELGTTENADDSSSNIETEDYESGTKISDPDNSSSNIDTEENYSENTSSNIDKYESERSKNVSSEIDENEIKSNNTTNTSHESNKCNSSESTEHSLSSESESLYDTCDSNQSSLSADHNCAKKEPIVAVERMNAFIFSKYYEKMLKSHQDEIREQTDDEDFESLANDSNEEIMHESRREKSDTEEIKVNAIEITDSSTTDDIISSEEYNDEEESNENNERYVSFVTTRRRNEITHDSMFQFDQSYASSSTDCDKTVLSNKVSMDKSFANIDVENNPEINLYNIHIERHIDKDLKTDTLSVDDKIALRKSTRISRLSNKSKALSPQPSDNFRPNLENRRMSIINTRRGSKISRQSNVTNIVSPTYGTKLSHSPTSKRILRMTIRKSSRLPEQSHCRSPEDNSGNEVTLTNSPEVNETVVENYSNDNENRDSISPFPGENISCMLKETVVSRPERLSYAGVEVKPAIVLQPGKKWERSLSIYRRMTMVADHFDESILEDDCNQNKGRKYRQSVISTMEMQECRDLLHNDSINSRRSTFVSNPGRPTIRFVKDPNFSRVSLNTTSVFDDLKGFLSEECDDTVIELSKLSIADSERDVTILESFHETERVTTARDYVLRRCNQTEPILFDECYPETVLKNCHKIGEGVYGEVFLWRGRDGRARVMKIVPIAGTVKVNGEHQKDFHEIISEIVIAMELSALRAPIAGIERQLDEGNDIHALDLHAIENATDIFNEVLAVRCVHGPYPSRLLDLWELYDECKGSENDNPAALPADQRYIVLELANAGQDLESYQFASAQQAHALFQQIAFGLAVAEEAFQFEHRDLHWGNVLIAPTEQKLATFVLRGRTYRVPRRGVAATVIDYSLSRLTLPLAADCAALYNDLAADDQLFDAVGDYQFELYRLMRDKLGNDWKNFEPYTNILWLHYIVDKMITALRYKRTNTKIHKQYIEKLKGIKNSILEYGSAVQYVLTDIDF